MKTWRVDSIRIEFKNNVNCYELNQQFKEQNTPINQRPKIVNRY